MFERVTRSILTDHLLKSYLATESRNDVQRLAYSRGADSHLIQRKASCPCGGGCPACPANSDDLTVSHPTDASEVEADRIAQKVIRMPIGEAGAAENGTKSQPDSIAPSTINRKCEAFDDEDKKIQKKPLPSDGGIPTQGAEHVQKAVGSSGQPLDVQTRNFFEPRLGYELSKVRIHTGSFAENSAKAINAKAYTFGKNIVFGNGEYKPHSESGKYLLAHELAHTTQQGNRSNQNIQRMIEVNSGVALDTMGYAVTKSGNFYTCPKIVKSSLFHEIFTGLLNSVRIFKLKGATSEQANASLKKQIAARSGIIAFASKKKYSFGAGAEFKMNPTYWNVTSSSWDLKPGADRQKAIEDLNIHPEEYKIACLAATSLTMEGGGKSPVTEDTGGNDLDWIPGDWGYIKNTKFPAAGGTPGLEGENIIYVGKDKFWGHFGPGIEYKTLAEWFAQVKAWNGEAKTLDSRQFPNAGLE